MAQEYIRTVLAGDGRWPYTAGGILFKDDIEGVFDWAGTGTGAGYLIEHSMDYTFEGDYSMHLKTRTTGTAASDIVEAYRRLGLVPERSIMLSTFYLPRSDVLLAYMYFGIRHYDGTDGEVARLRYDYANTKWQYLNSSNTYSDIAGATQLLHHEAWHSFTLSVNFATGKYISLISEGSQFDLSQYSYYTFTIGEAGHLRIVFKLETEGASPAEVYYDNVTVRIL